MALGTTYFAGNDFSSFTTTGAVGVVTSSGYRSAWVSSAMQVTSSSTADPPPDLVISPVFTANSLMWVHGNCTMTASGIGNTLNATLLRCLDPGGVARIVVRGTGVTGGLKVDKRDSGGSFTNLFTATGTPLGSGPNAQNLIDLKVIYDVAGEVTLFINAVEVGTFSGDVTTDLATQLAQVDFSSISGTLNWSEILVSDSLTINAGVFRLSPQSAGTTQDWSGVVADINKTRVDDTTFISSGTNDQLSGWTTPVTFPTGNWLIQSIVQEARAAIGLSGPQHFDWYVRTADGSDHVAGVSNAPAVSFDNFPNYIWAQNPHTSADWAVGDIVAGFNLGVKSLA